jgi:hypothetical protein
MTDPTSPGGAGEAPCPAEEWHRDGRGLWAVRRCRNWHTQKGSPHSFTQWEYNAQPPGLTEQSRQQEALRALLVWAKAERDDWSERNADRYWQMNRVVAQIESAAPPQPKEPR